MEGMRIFGGGGGRESKGYPSSQGPGAFFFFVYSKEFPGIKRRCGFGGLILIASNPLTRSGCVMFMYYVLF